MTGGPVFEEPHNGLQDSYRDLIREFLDAGEPLVPFPLSFPNADFSAFLERLTACARGEGIPPDFVPHSTYWLVVNDVVVGVANLRHSLTDALRREVPENFEDDETAVLLWSIAVAAAMYLYLRYPPPCYGYLTEWNPVCWGQLPK